MKNNPSVRLCFESELKDIERYPEWVLEDESDSDLGSDSDSEFQNLFKMIQMNEYRTGSDESPVSSLKLETPLTSSFESRVPSKTGASFGTRSVSEHSLPPSSAGARKTAHFLEEVTISESKKVKVGVAQRQSGKVRIGITRPTMFLKSSTTTDVRKSLQHKRVSTSLSVGGGANAAALRILFLQNAFAENVLPLYRKKDRVYISIRQVDFNRCHKSEAIKVADRVKRILNKNYIYLNDRDIAEDLELKLEKLIQSKVIRKIKEMHDKWKLREVEVPKSPIAVKISKDENKVSLINQLDFSMPHRDFETDITKYVKRLRELSDILNNQSNVIELKEEDIFTADITIEKDEGKKIRRKYILIPTLERYNKKRVKIKKPKISVQKKEDNEYKYDDMKRKSSCKEKLPSLWKRLSESVSKSWYLKSCTSQQT